MTENIQMLCLLTSLLGSDLELTVTLGYNTLLITIPHNSVSYKSIIRQYIRML